MAIMMMENIMIAKNAILLVLLVKILINALNVLEIEFLKTIKSVIAQYNLFNNLLTRHFVLVIKLNLF